MLLWKRKRATAENAPFLDGLSPDERRQKLIVVTEALPDILWNIEQLPHPILQRYNGPHSGWMVSQQWDGTLARMTSYDHNDGRTAVFEERGSALYICDRTKGLAQAGVRYIDDVNDWSWNDTGILHDCGMVRYWDHMQAAYGDQYPYTSDNIARHIGHFIKTYGINEQVNQVLQES